LRFYQQFDDRTAYIQFVDPDVGREVTLECKVELSTAPDPLDSSIKFFIEKRNVRVYHSLKFG
jgi:hypothetical protein